MLRSYRKSSLEGLTVTEVDGAGPARVRVDSELLAAAHIMPGEHIRVVRHGGGAFECHAEPAPRGSGTVSVGGLPGYQPGDRLDLHTECLLVDREALEHQPRRITVDENNRPVG
ncbi:MAG: aspartate 1-decarboxylase [Candidatus Eisenbacteria bacterium]|nr:aspartate 1-decarboxylase [Candidatus Eisenbacteria bacterium]